MQLCVCVHTCVHACVFAHVCAGDRGERAASVTWVVGIILTEEMTSEYRLEHVSRITKGRPFQAVGGAGAKALRLRTHLVYWRNGMEASVGQSKQEGTEQEMPSQKVRGPAHAPLLFPTLHLRSLFSNTSPSRLPKQAGCPLASAPVPMF